MLQWRTDSEESGAVVRSPRLLRLGGATRQKEYERRNAQRDAERSTHHP